MVQIQNVILEQKEQISIYRASHGLASINEEYYFVELLYFILSRKFNVNQRTKYEPCFNIITSIIDNNIFDKHYQKIIKRIQKHHDYFFGKDSIYSDICGFHINIMAYLIFKNQYQLLKSYMYYEEPKERSSQHTRPQIPNTINNILLNFIGNNSVFHNTQIFSANTSSYKYKFYTLFLLLIYSMRFAEKCKKNLSRIHKKDWQYQYLEKDLKAHSECNIDFKNINFDNLMSFINIKHYKEFINNFSQETELLNSFDINDNDIRFIDQILNDTISKIKNAQNNLLKRKFKNVAVLEFSIYKQKELKAKNLNELIDIKIHPIYESLKNMTFSSVDNSGLHDLYLGLYDKTYNKRQLLSGQYQYIFDRAPINDFYGRLFNLLKKYCEKIPSIDDLPDNIENNYQILSNIERRQSFISFGFKKEDIKVKTCTVNGKKDDDSEFADVDFIRINNKNIMISEYNNHFHYLNDNGMYPHAIILFDSSKISIEVGKKESLKYTEMKDGNVQILDNTQIKIRLPNDKSLGYCIVKEQNTHD